jgi:hypothetical protein
MLYRCDRCSRTFDAEEADDCSSRNDTLGHGAARPEARYRADLQQWLPVLGDLLAGVAGLSDCPLCLAVAEDRAVLWMGPEPPTSTIPGAFPSSHVGRFVLRRPVRNVEGEERPVRCLFPFSCYLPDPVKENRLHYSILDQRGTGGSWCEKPDPTDSPNHPLSAVTDPNHIVVLLAN